MEGSGPEQSPKTLRTEKLLAASASSRKEGMAIFR